MRFIIFSGISSILAYMFYFKLGGYALLDNNEGLYAQIPLEMLRSGDTVIPTLNGNPYIEKPPLLYWLIMLVYKIFGVTEWTSRLITATAGLLICILTGYFARITRYEETTWLCPLMLGTSLGFVLFSRMVFFDVLLTLFFSLALFSFYIWYEKENKTWLYIAYTSLALAILAKGFLALILAGSIVILFFCLDLTRFKKVLSFFSLGPIMCCLFIVAPWHIMAAQQESGFAWFYFINEHFLRFLDLREPRDYYHGPFYYYIPRILGYIFPWSLFALFLFRKPSIKGMPKLNKFLWVWFLVTLIFFSLSRAKANYYMVIGLPPLMMCLAMSLEDLIDRKKSFLLKFLTSLITFLITSILIYFYYFDLDPRYDSYKALLSQEILIGWSLYCTIGIILIWAFSKFSYSAPLFLASLMAPILYFAIEAAIISEDLYSMKNIVRDIPKENLLQAKDIYLYRDYEKVSTALYYAKKPLPIIESHSKDLWYGMHHPYNFKYFITMKAFETILKENTIYVIARDKYIEELKEKGLCLKSHRGEKILMSNYCKG